MYRQNELRKYRSMKKSKRYNTAHLIEDQYEPGSNNQVLKNKLGITNPDEMDDIEAVALKKPMEKLFSEIIEKSDVIL